MKIVELKAGDKVPSLTGQVVSVSPTRDVNTRFGPSRVADAVIKDDSGSIKLTLWNEQIDQVTVGSNVAIENGYVTSFRGETQLNVSRAPTGKLTLQK